LFILFFHRVNGTRFFTTGQDIVKEISHEFSTHHEKKTGEKRQILPIPTAAPAAAGINPIWDDQAP
jgi:hypothetical protein